MTKPGRNDPCPCGSGKKYKKCCALKSSMQRRETKVISSGQPSSLSSLFQKKVTPIPSQSESSLKERIGKDPKEELENKKEDENQEEVQEEKKPENETDSEIDL